MQVQPEKLPKKISTFCGYHIYHIGWSSASRGSLSNTHGVTGNLLWLCGIFIYLICIFLNVVCWCLSIFIPDFAISRVYAFCKYRWFPTNIKTSKVQCTYNVWIWIWLLLYWAIWGSRLGVHCTCWRPGFDLQVLKFIRIQGYSSIAPDPLHSQYNVDLYEIYRKE